MDKKTSGLLWVTLAYVVAFGVAWVAARFTQDETLWTRITVADVAATLAIFAFSYSFNNTSMYDAYWSVAPMVISGWLFVQSPWGTGDGRNLLVFALVMLYGFRLTINWIRGWPGLHHQDWRYEDFRRNTGKWYWLVSFWGLHFFPTVMVWLGCVPLLFAQVDQDTPFHWLDVVAAAVTFLAVALELVADEQMRAFRKDPLNKGKTMTSGLWAYSRHPNYVGETLFWVGLSLFGVAASPANWYWCLLGSAAMFLMFQFASIPMMEKRSMANRPGYAEATKGIRVYFF
jgi:steroid 5-alpha reductase family enzyme